MVEGKDHCRGFDLEQATMLVSGLCNVFDVIDDDDDHHDNDDDDDDNGSDNDDDVQDNFDEG